MEIIFLDGKLRKICNDKKSLQRKYGPRQAKLIGRRLDELRAADVLLDITYFPQARFHQLKNRKPEEYSLDIEHPYRLIICVANDPVPRKEDLGIDLEKVTKIYILRVENTHG